MTPPSLPPPERPRARPTPRLWLGLLGLGLAGSVACAPRAATEPGRLYLGFFPNVTHAVALSAYGRESFARALAPAEIEWKAFASGPQAVEAIFAGAIDACYLGPGPATIGYVRSRGEALVILAGAASGGAGLVVRRAANIHRPEDLPGHILATPQLGNTQDVALRRWLDQRRLRTIDRGGDIKVLPLANAQILALMKRGELDGAWVPEPWVTRLVREADGVLLLDERELWPEGRFPSAVLVAARASLATKRDLITRLVAAHVDEVDWVTAHPAEARKLGGEAIRRVTGKGLPPAILAEAYDHVTPTWDPMPAAIAEMAAGARALRYLPEGGLEGLIDGALLDAARAARATRPAPPAETPAPGSAPDTRP
ncbi:MAG TPA: ABC transporter substrate-binding protein [Polyangia bacterium]|jgi:NitT/TauT family transport system substrate-binding protein|nr:ABC transporter substrate-binding protein [Polyangia bacterium]